MTLRDEIGQLEQAWTLKLGELASVYKELALADAQRRLSLKRDASHLEASLDEHESAILDLRLQERIDSFRAALVSLDYKKQKEKHYKLLQSCSDVRIASAPLRGTRQRGLYWIAQRLIAKVAEQSQKPARVSFDFGAPVRSEREAVLHHLSNQLKPGLPPVPGPKRLRCFVDLLAKRLRTTSVVVLFDQMNKLPEGARPMPETLWSEVTSDLAATYPKRIESTWAFALFLHHEEAAEPEDADPAIHLPQRFDKSVLAGWRDAMELPPASLDDEALDAILEQTGGLPEEVVRRLGDHFECHDCDPGISPWWVGYT